MRRRPEEGPRNRTHRRRYLVRLSCVPNESIGTCHYIARIQSWAARMNRDAEVHQRVFNDECEFIETINSLLPHGSDVRNIFSLIESPDGFIYLLQLTDDQASTLSRHGK
jgi:hypothetical protein